MARDEVQLQQGLNQMISIMLSFAARAMAQREEKHRKQIPHI
jgi:hypothetical protein